MLDELEAGREPRLRRGDPVLPTEPSAPDVADEPGPTTAPPPGTRGLGPAARRRAQAARRRERQRAAGLVRTTFDVPATLANTISEMIDRMVTWMSEGVQVILEVEAVSTELARPGAVLAPNLSQSVVACVLDDMVTHAGDCGEQDISPLFEDIQAVVRLERKTMSASTAIASAQIIKPQGDKNF